jgi:conjugal transfer pilus assembly protein TraV
MPRTVEFETCLRVAAALPALALLSGCGTLGKVMSPYSETFSCKNSDHGQCIDPAQAHADAVAGVASRSNPAVTRDKALLRDQQRRARRGRTAAGSYSGYRDSLYRELQGLIEAPETPMLRAGRTVRTLILPYADRARPDRLYMPRFVYSILERPQWVVGDYLVTSPSLADRAPVLGQVREKDKAGSPSEAELPSLATDIDLDSGQVLP